MRQELSSGVSWCKELCCPEEKCNVYIQDAVTSNDKASLEQ